MPSVHIDGAEYALPLDFTYREMNLMKRVSGLRAGELWEAIEAGDTDADIALAAVALKRGRPEMTWQQIEADLLDSKAGSITFDYTSGVEDAASPPVLAAVEDAASA